MNFEKLEMNIMDMIKEEQVKLGYQSETIHLYYPMQSLNRFLDSDCDAEGMKQALCAFSEFTKERLGAVKVTNKRERFCFTVPPQGVDYVHEQLDPGEFIVGFIREIEKHGCTIEDLKAQFYRFSENVHVEQVSNGEFDYLLYFEDGKPDDYRYCITDEGCHMIYHRYAKEDYEDFGF